MLFKVFTLTVLFSWNGVSTEQYYYPSLAECNANAIEWSNSNRVIATKCTQSYLISDKHEVKK